MFPNLISTRFQPRRYCPNGIGNWSGHLPFAADLIQAARPSLVVELGTEYGESYFGFCQAIQEQGIECTAYAVDSWQGDAHSGSYGPDVFEDVSAYNAAHYGSFSNLLRMSFDEALTRFSDGSIDLLHLDGCHTYAAVKHDFETWLPKVRAGGIVLIHDIAVRQSDFGAWEFWEQVFGRLPSFAFHHSHGLGVIANGDVGQFADPFLGAMFGGTSSSQAIRDYYVMCAERLHYAHQATVPICQVFSPTAAGYSEERSAASALLPGEWVAVDFSVPAPQGRLRLDPVNRAAFVEISEVVVDYPRTGVALWRLDPSRLNEITCAGTAVRIPDDSRLIILSYGDDPQLYLPALEVSEASSPVRCRARLRMNRDSQAFRQFIEKYEAVCSELVELQACIEHAKGDLARVNAERDIRSELQRQAEAEGARLRGESAAHALRAELVATELGRLSAERDACVRLQRQAEAEATRISAEREAITLRAEHFAASLTRLQAEFDSSVDLRQQAQAEIVRLGVAIETLSERLLTETRRSQAVSNSLQAAHHSALAEHAAIKQSLSWRITAPLRHLGSLVAFRRPTR